MKTKYQEAAYIVSWQMVISAIKRRKYLGDKTADQLSDEDYQQIRELLHSILDHHVDDLIEMSFEEYEVIRNL